MPAPLISNPLPPWISDAGTFIQNAPPRLPDLIDGVIPHAAFVQIAGPPATGKTLTALELVRAVSTGTPGFGRFLAQQGNVIVVEEEHHPSTFATRLAGVGVDPQRTHIVHRQGFRFDDPKWVRDLAAVIAQLDARLVVLDPLADLHEGDEQDAKDMGRVVDGLKRLAKGNPNCAFLVLHHTVKAAWRGSGPSLANARGSGRMAGSLDVIYEQSDTKQPLTFRLTCLKNKDGPPIAEHLLTFQIAAHGPYVCIATPVGTRAAPVPPHGASAAQIASRVLSAIATASPLLTSHDKIATQINVRKCEVSKIINSLLKCGQIVRVGRAYAVPPPLVPGTAGTTPLSVPGSGKVPAPSGTGFPPVPGVPLLRGTPNGNPTAHLGGQPAPVGAFGVTNGAMPQAISSPTAGEEPS